MKIDFTKIDGYREDMTAEEKLALLDKYEAPHVDYTGYIKKDTFDKTASELAEAKRQLKAKMTEDEQKAAEQAAREAEKDALLESLKREKAVFETKARFIGLGCDEKSAAEAAAAFAEGDTEKVFGSLKTHIENVRKSAVAAALADTPKPPAGTGANVIDKKAFDAMSTEDQIKYIKENPNWKEKLKV